MRDTAEGMTHSAPEPNAAVLTALVALLSDFRSVPAMQSMTRGEIDGYARGFLLQYPALAHAPKLVIACRDCVDFLRRAQKGEASMREAGEIANSLETLLRLVYDHG